jgi:Domain of unknown function (DUF1857)
MKFDSRNVEMDQAGGRGVVVEVSRSFPVNVPGEPLLGRAEVWHGLELKARNALPFVKRMQKCVVLEEHDGWLVRDIEIRDEKHRERVTFTPQEQVRFDRIDGPTTGYILNQIQADEAGELQLRFTFRLHRKDMTPGGPAEVAYFAQVEDQYADAVRTTLTQIRQIGQEQAI